MLGVPLLAMYVLQRRRRSTRTIRNKHPLIFEDGKLFVFHFLFPGGKKGYVQRPGNWKRHVFKLDEVPVEVVFGTAKEKT